MSAARGAILLFSAILLWPLLGTGPEGARSVVPGAAGSPDAAGSPGALVASPADLAASPAATCQPALATGRSILTLEVDGTPREVIVHLPSAAAGPRLPAVIGFHGYTAHAWQLEETSGLSDLAEEHDFVVAYPEALGSPTEWHFGGSYADGPEDLALSEALMSRLVEDACVDPARIVIAGHSMGGAMASDVACRLADRVAAVALVAALWVTLPCEPARPVPVVAMHALDDEVLPYAGGPIGGVGPGVPPTLAVEEAIGAWAAHDGCGLVAATDEQPDGSAVLSWPDCAAPVTLLRLPAGGHAWPSTASGLIAELAIATG
jgi:polyhydroxybutyrate depolymerase